MHPRDQTAERARGLYLELLKRALKNSLHLDRDDLRQGRDLRDEGRPWRGDVAADWRQPMHTMASFRRLDSVQAAIEQVLAEGVPGDLIETGVWRGGTAILMRGVLAAHGVEDRTVWVADSFAGLPKPDVGRFPQDQGLDLSSVAELAVTVERVRSHFDRYGLLDDRVRFVEGWFRDTLPTLPCERLAVLRLDGDLYESTWIALESLYPRLSVGGWVLVDDYGALGPCREAVHDFRARHAITDAIVATDWTESRWRRSGSDRAERPGTLPSATRR